MDITIHMTMMVTMKRQNLLKTIYPVIALYFYSFFSFIFIQTNNDDDGIMLQCVYVYKYECHMLEMGK